MKLKFSTTLLFAVTSALSLSACDIDLKTPARLKAEFDAQVSATPVPTATPRPTATATPRPTATATPAPTAAPVQYLNVLDDPKLIKIMAIKSAKDEGVKADLTEPGLHLTPKMLMDAGYFEGSAKDYAIESVSFKPFEKCDYNEKNEIGFASVDCTYGELNTSESDTYPGVKVVSGDFVIVIRSDENLEIKFLVHFQLVPFGGVTSGSLSFKGQFFPETIAADKGTHFPFSVGSLIKKGTLAGEGVIQVDGFDFENDPGLVSWETDCKDSVDDCFIAIKPSSKLKGESISGHINFSNDLKETLIVPFQILVE